MISMGLTPEGQRALVRTLAAEHEIGVQVSLLDRDHNHLGDLTGPQRARLLSGQVNIDANADVTRQLQMTFADERGSIRVDTSDGRPELRRMIRVHYVVFVKEVLNRRVAIPVFTGPITAVSRDGVIVTLEAQGKEHIAQSPTWRSKTFVKGANRVAVVRQIMGELTGETRFSFPVGWTSRTSKTINMRKESPAWKQAKATAKSARGQLFYNGRGTLVLRPRPVRSSFTFRDGDGGMLLSVPKTEEGSAEVINTVRAIGAVPKGKKNPMIHTDFLPKNHPYSPWSMIRGGKLQYLPEIIEDDSLRTKSDVDNVVKRRIQELLMDEQMVTFDTLPMPLLEEHDLFVIDAKGTKLASRVAQMSIPLTRDGVSTVGYIAPVNRRRR